MDIQISEEASLTFQLAHYVWKLV